MKGLAAKNALITGASSGIGQAITSLSFANAIRLATEGCNIAINYRKSSEDAE